VVINQDIADKLREIAALLEEQGAGPFRVNAYRRAVSTVDNVLRKYSPTTQLCWV
jgi:putative hydrolase